MTKEKRKQVSDESYPDASVAQPDTEHLAFNQTCAGSNPAGGTEELVFIPIKISEEEKKMWAWLRELEERLYRRVYSDLRVPKRYLQREQRSGV